MFSLHTVDTCAGTSFLLLFIGSVAFVMHIFQNSLCGWKVHLGILGSKKGEALAKMGRNKPQSEVNTMPTSGGGIAFTEHRTRASSLTTSKCRQIMGRPCCAPQPTKTSCSCHFEASHRPWLPQAHLHKTGVTEGWSMISSCVHSPQSKNSDNY